MQSAKDTFYVMLRDRIAAANPARTAVVRGVERPAVLVEENEIASAVTPTDGYVLRWNGLEVDAQGALPLVRMECVIRYETAGSAGAGGVDRGRLLAAMDAELLAALLAEPRRTVQTDFSALPAQAMGSQVFWGVPVLGAVETTAGRTGRTATVTVYSYGDMEER